MDLRNLRGSETSKQRIQEKKKKNWYTNYGTIYGISEDFWVFLTLKLWKIKIISKTNECCYNDWHYLDINTTIVIVVSNCT